METIKELLERKKKAAQIDLDNAIAEKNEMLIKLDQRIAAFRERVDVYENLEGLAWDVYARNELAKK